MFAIKFKPAFFSMIPLFILACWSFVFGLSSIFPWGMTLGLMYFSYLKMNLDLDFSFRFYRRLQVMSFFAL
ncbi:MAG: hypothetical protein L6Q33_15755, partial [Bacteriovoracaceae bacterium]|nr:hypothetical protein [Bacteriovoracaceae bacterium]